MGVHHGMEHVRNSFEFLQCFIPSMFLSVSFHFPFFENVTQPSVLDDLLVGSRTSIDVAPSELNTRCPTTQTLGCGGSITCKISIDWTGWPDSTWLDVTHGVTHGGLNKHLKSSGFWKEIKDDMSLSHSFSPSLSLSLSQNLSLSLSHTHTHTLTYSLTHPYVYTLFLVEHTPTYFHYCDGYTYNTSYLDDPAYQLSTNFW